MTFAFSSPLFVTGKMRKWICKTEADQIPEMLQKENPMKN
jgi:hypothetical protein